MTKRITIKVTAADLARAFLSGTKTGTANVESLGLTSEGRPIRWIELGKNGKILLRGFIGKQDGVIGNTKHVWEQKYRGSAPIDD